MKEQLTPECQHDWLCLPSMPPQYKCQKCGKFKIELTQPTPDQLAEQLAQMAHVAILSRETIPEVKAKFEALIQQATEPLQREIDVLKACNEKGSTAFEKLEKDYVSLLQADNIKAKKITQLESEKAALVEALAKSNNSIQTSIEEFEHLKYEAFPDLMRKNLERNVALLTNTTQQAQARDTKLRDAVICEVLEPITKAHAYHADITRVSTDYTRGMEAGLYSAKRILELALQKAGT